MSEVWEVSANYCGCAFAFDSVIQVDLVNFASNTWAKMGSLKTSLQVEALCRAGTPVALKVWF